MMVIQLHKQGMLLFMVLVNIPFLDALKMSSNTKREKKNPKIWVMYSMFYYISHLDFCLLYKYMLDFSSL